MNTRRGTRRTRRDHARPGGARRAAVKTEGWRRLQWPARLLGLGALVVAFVLGCDDSPVGTDVHAPEPCILPAASVPASALTGVDRGAVRVAVRDAEGRLATSLPEGEATDELQSALRVLDGVLAGPDAELDTGCRMVHLARTALETFEDVPHTRPDRAAVRLVLELATATLAGGPS